MRAGWRPWPGVPAYLAVPVGAALLLAVGAAASAASGRLPASVTAALCGLVVLATVTVTQPGAAVPLGVLGWMTASAFGRAPYGALRPSAGEAAVAAVACGAGAVAGAAAGCAGRRLTRPSGARTLEGVIGLAAFAAAVDRRRQALGWLLAAALLPCLTLATTALRAHLSLTDDLLVYLLAVVGVAVVGGFWPAVAAAVASSLLINWYFTPPYHTLTIAQPDNLLALWLFVVVAVAVSSVVHLAARRLVLARHSQAGAEALARLARSVLGDDDTPRVVLQHLHDTLGVGSELLERTATRWTRVAVCGDIADPRSHRILVRDDVALDVHGEVPAESRLLVEAAAGQAAAALDRDRLRTQAAHAEALAAGNRMRTALLAAVSHDLRTPLASIKASISSLRQTDVRWSPDDEAALLETIDESTDRLSSLIGNLLDMSRVQTGALQPYLAPASVDEIVPVALRGTAGGDAVRLDMPDDLPLVLTDAGLLERAVANIVANAVRYSPDGQPPTVTAERRDDVVLLHVVDSGPGVDDADHERMFAPFQRLGDQSPSTGVGLGLAVARGFVEAVGGRLRPSATPGGGLTMTLEIPVASADAWVQARAEP